jgi:hypothetical protein
VKRFAPIALVALITAAFFALSSVHADPIQGRGVSSTATVTASPPLTGGGALSGNPTIGIQAASASQHGYFSSSDYSKLAAITFDGTSKFGFGVTPTNTVTLGAAGNGLAVNNVDGTNAEFLSIVPVSNVLTISTAVSGGGTLRNILVRGGTGGGQILFSSAGSLTYSGVGATQTTYHGFTWPTATASSGVQSFISATGTVTQSGSATFNTFLCNPTISGTGSGGIACFRAQAGGSDRFRVDASSGKIGLQGTVTAAGTTGAQTINKPLGTVNFVAGATTLVVTNSLVSTSPYTPVTCTVQTNDSTAKSCGAVPASGSVTLFLNAAATAETRALFIVHDAL